MSLLYFLTDVVLRTDYVSHVAKQALNGIGSEETLDPATLARKKPGPATVALRSHGQRLLALCLVRLIDNFQSYVVDLLREILAKEPRILKSSQPTLSLEYAFQFGSMEELVTDVVESRVSDLSYQGFEKLKAWCAERGIVLAVSSADDALLADFIATRNLISHNRGLVDRKYLRAVPVSVFKLGSQRTLGIDELFTALALLNRTVIATDEAASSKFDLCRVAVQRSAGAATAKPNGRAHR